METSLFLRMYAPDPNPEAGAASELQLPSASFQPVDGMVPKLAFPGIPATSPNHFTGSLQFNLVGLVLGAPTMTAPENSPGIAVSLVIPSSISMLEEQPAIERASGAFSPGIPHHGG